MVNDSIELIKNINLFDVFISLIFIYSIIQCFMKGFSLSLISSMKWIVSTIVTIILVPKLQPVVKNYIDSEFINNVGLGAGIFIITLFLTIVIGKSISRAVTWTGVGSIDKTFGILFGFFKGYVISVCIFSILNWFYPYNNWGISAEEAISFNIIQNSLSSCSLVSCILFNISMCSFVIVCTSDSCLLISSSEIFSSLPNSLIF